MPQLFEITDPFRLCVALAPLALYFLRLSFLNFSRRPSVVSGTRDAAMLGIGLSGLILVGPIELLFTMSPRIHRPDITPYIWMLVVVLYCLLLTLGVLLSAPRLVIYNISFNQLR